MNINNLRYWNHRFSSGDWEIKRGRQQTKKFACEQVEKLGLPHTFSGTILDFGCGLGDAFPIYKQSFPQAKFIGVDFSQEAINKCVIKYSNIADFICSGYEGVPSVDVIIASNVFEHLSNDVQIAKELAKKCKQLFIITPYKETISSLEQQEHINSYDKTSFETLACLNKTVYKSYGLGRKKWWEIIIHVWIKNIFRLIIRRKIWVYKAPKEIMFEIKGDLI